jgi:predicted  nucleic acid-binding Zn-ribbon protein
MEDKNTYQGEMETKLQHLGTELDTLKAKADQATAEAKLEIDKHIQELTAKQEELKQRLADLKTSTDEAWETLKTGVQNAWDELTEAFEEAVSKFK